MTLLMLLLDESVHLDGSIPLWGLLSALVLAVAEVMRLEVKQMQVERSINKQAEWHEEHFDHAKDQNQHQSLHERDKFENRITLRVDELERKMDANAKDMREQIKDGMERIEKSVIRELDDLKLAYVDTKKTMDAILVSLAK